MEDNIYYVYMYLDENNVPFYVGRGKGCRYTLAAHQHCSNKWLVRKINKHFSSIKIYFLKTNVSYQQSIIWEVYWINYIGRKDLGCGSLVNLTDGGEGNFGYRPTLESRKKMSTSHLGNKSNLGRKLSEEHKRNIGLGGTGKQVGKKLSDETKKKLSDAMKRRRQDPNFVDFAHTPEAIQKLKASLRGKKKSPEQMEKLRQLNLGNKYWVGKKHTEESKRKMSRTKQQKRIERSLIAPHTDHQLLD